MQEIIKELKEEIKKNPKKKITKKYIKDTYGVTQNKATEIFVAIYDDGDSNILEEDICGLSHEEKLFCLEYLKSYNMKNAAVRAGYTPSQGISLLRKKKIKEGLKTIQKMRENDLYVNSLNIIEMYLGIAFSDITDYVEFGTETVPALDSYGRTIRDDNGKIKMVTKNVIKLKESKSIDGRFIQEIKQGRDGVTIKLFDKLAALDKLSKIFNVDSQESIEISKLKVELMKEQIRTEKGKADLFDNKENTDFKIIIERAEKK